MRFNKRFLLLPTTVAAWVTSPPSSRSLSRVGCLFGCNRQESSTLARGNNARNKDEIRVLGVCGGIGSGKTFACQMLVNELGCWAHLEADAMAHKVYEPNSQAVHDIVQEFGSDILLENGQVNRKRLGEVVFTSPDQMSKLERIVWPHVKTEIMQIIDSYRGQSIPTSKIPVIILEAAVLIDAGWDDLLDGLWVIYAPEDQALKRLQTHRGFSAQEAKTRIAAQKVRSGIGNLQQEIDKGTVTCVIVHDGTEDELKAKLAKALEDDSCWYTNRQQR